MYVIFKNLAISLIALIVFGCGLKNEPPKDDIVQTFRDNRKVFDNSVLVIKDLDLKEGRIEVYNDDPITNEEGIAELFTLEPVPVKRVIIYPSTRGGLIIDYIMHSFGLGVSGNSWSIVFLTSGWPSASWPEIALHSSCEDVDMKGEVDNNQSILSSSCRLDDLWELTYNG